MIAAYLNELAGALAFDPALATRVVTEAREHLADAAAEDDLAMTATKPSAARSPGSATHASSPPNSLPSRWRDRPGASVSSSCWRSSLRWR